MNLKVISSLLFVFCALIVRAKVNAESFSTKTRQPYSLTSRHESIENEISPAHPVKSAILNPKLFKRGNHWTFEEEQLLLKLREQELSWEQIKEEFFPKRSWTALIAKHHKLTKDQSKIRKAPKPWTDEEVELLLELKESEPPLSWEDITKSFPGRSKTAVGNKYYMMSKVVSVPKTFHTQRPWTADEIELLLKLGKEGVPWKERVHFFNNRTLKALKERYKKLVPPKPPPFGRFTSEEDNLIVEAVGLDKTTKEISQILGRTEQAVRRRKKKLGL